MGQEKKFLFTNRDLKRLIIPLIIEQILAVTVGMAARRPPQGCPWWI